jgi:hypothetical protein
MLYTKLVKLERTWNGNLQERDFLEDVAFIRVGLNVKGKDVLVLYCTPHQKAVLG